MWGEFSMYRVEVRMEDCCFRIRCTKHVEENEETWDTRGAVVKKAKTMERPDRTEVDMVEIIPVIRKEAETSLDVILASIPNLVGNVVPVSRVLRFWPTRNFINLGERKETPTTLRQTQHWYS
jgi:hypothetical protein